MGRAIDLDVGRVVAVTDNAIKQREPNLLQTCTLSLTGQKVLDRVITNLGVFDVVEGGLRIMEMANGITGADVRAATHATIVA